MTGALQDMFVPRRTPVIHASLTPCTSLELKTASVPHSWIRASKRRSMRVRRSNATFMSTWPDCFLDARGGRGIVDHPYHATKLGKLDESRRGSRVAPPSSRPVNFSPRLDLPALSIGDEREVAPPQ